MQTLLAASSYVDEIIGSSHRQIADSQKLIRDVMASSIGKSRERMVRTEARISRSITLVLETGTRNPGSEGTLAR